MLNEKLKNNKNFCRMTTDYVYNVIKSILSTRVLNDPNCVPYAELAKAVNEDMQMAINQLITEKRITFRRNVNGFPIFYDNVGEATR